jgi:hypothetical protein
VAEGLQPYLAAQGFLAAQGLWIAQGFIGVHGLHWFMDFFDPRHGLHGRHIAAVTPPANVRAVNRTPVGKFKPELDVSRWCIDARALVSGFCCGMIRPRWLTTSIIMIF